MIVTQLLAGRQRQLLLAELADHRAGAAGRRRRRVGDGPARIAPVAGRAAPALVRGRRCSPSRVLVVVLSYRPVAQPALPAQAMNARFDPLHLVNTYGAFGSVTRVRHEVVIEGTDDAVAAETRRGASTSSRASPATPPAAAASSRRTTCGSTG